MSQADPLPLRLLADEQGNTRAVHSRDLEFNPEFNGAPASDNADPVHSRALDFSSEFDEAPEFDSAEPAQNSPPYVIERPVFADDPLTAPTPTSNPSETSARTDFSRRELALIPAGIIVGGILTFGLLLASGGRSRDASPDAAQPSSNSAAATAAPKAVPANRPKWNGANRVWVGNQRKAVAFELAADEKVAIWQGYAKPVLVVRCLSNKIDAFVYTESPAQMESRDGRRTVRIGLDDGPDATERWEDSADHDALVAPDGAEFARRIAGARTMRFGYTPHNAPRVVATFHVDGLANVMVPAAAQCGRR